MHTCARTYQYTRKSFQVTHRTRRIWVSTQKMIYFKPVKGPYCRFPDRFSQIMGENVHPQRKYV